MASFGDNDNESPIDVVTPPTVKKARAAPKGTPKAAGDTAGENNESSSSIEVRLLIEMFRESSNGKFNWAAISEKLDLPSAGATSKRAERLLKRYDMKLSDLTGGRGGRTPKGGDNGTPASKRKTGGASDALDSPTKRQSRAKPAAKKTDAQGGDNKSENGVKKEADDDVFL